jgi:hypothetical protein
VERRAEFRRSVVCRVEIEILDQSPSIQQEGLQEDRSPAGAGICVKKPIAAGTRVRVLHQRQSTIGTVQQCRRYENGYFIGILFDCGVTAA